MTGERGSGGIKREGGEWEEEERWDNIKVHVRFPRSECETC